MYRLIASRRRNPGVLLLAVCATLGLIATSCSSGDQGADDTTTASSSEAVETSTTTTTEAIPDYRSFIAQANEDVKEVIVYDTPGGEQKKLDAYATGEFKPVVIPNPLESKAIATFLVKEPLVQSDAGIFHQVYLPTRPNFSTGYIRDEDVTIFHTDKAVEISLGGRTLSVFNEGEKVASYPVAIGTAENPTPTGLFFIKELLTPPEGSSYGALAYSLSGHSESILDSDEFPDGVIGVHGTNKPELIGQAVSHGCVRLEDSTILDLQAREIPLGTPVEIVN